VTLCLTHVHRQLPLRNFDPRCATVSALGWKSLHARYEQKNKLYWHANIYDSKDDESVANFTEHHARHKEKTTQAVTVLMSSLRRLPRRWMGCCTPVNVLDSASPHSSHCEDCVTLVGTDHTGGRRKAGQQGIEQELSTGHCPDMADSAA